MSDIPIFAIQNLLIGALVFVLAFCLLKIRRLTGLLAEEKHKRTLPILSVGIDSLEKGLHLKNDSACAAKDIKVDDVKVAVDYGFKKELVLRFEEIGLLQPNEEIKLKYRIFDDKYELPTDRIGAITASLLSSSFEVLIHYANIENIKFTTTIGKDKDKFYIKEVKPSETVS